MITPSCSKTTTTESYRCTVIAGRLVRPALFLEQRLEAFPVPLSPALRWHRAKRRQASTRVGGQPDFLVAACGGRWRGVVDAEKSSRNLAQFGLCIAKLFADAADARNGPVAALLVGVVPRERCSEPSNRRASFPRCVVAGRAVACFQRFDTCASTRGGMLTRHAGAFRRWRDAARAYVATRKKNRGVVDTFKNRD